MYDELVKALRGCVLSKPCDGCPYYDPNGPTEKCATVDIAAADAIEKLSAYAMQLEDLRKDGYYLQKTKMMTYGQATMTMPLPQPPKEVLTGTDMRGGIRRDEAGNVIDWGITGPPGDVGKTEEGE